MLQAQYSLQQVGRIYLSYSSLLESIFSSSNEEVLRIEVLFKSLLKQLGEKIGPALRVESEIPPLFVANGLI